MQMRGFVTNIDFPLFLRPDSNDKRVRELPQISQDQAFYSYVNLISFLWYRHDYGDERVRELTQMSHIKSFAYMLI